MNRNLPRPTAALLVASLSLVISCTGVAMAATGNLVLGAKNQAAKTTTLKTTAAAKGATIKLKNAGGGPAAIFVTQAGKAPFRVKGATRVDNLNSDLLDGFDSSAFRKASDPIDATTLDGIDSTSFLRSDSTPKAVSVSNNGSAQVTATMDDVILTANNELYDPSDMFQTQGDRLVATVTGTYVVTATVAWNASAVGSRFAALLDKDAVTFAADVGPAAVSPAVTRQNLSGVIHLVAGDFVRVEAIQDSGDNLAVRLLRFQMAYVGA